MQQIDSEETVAPPTMLQGPPPRELCITIREVGKGADNKLFHEDILVHNKDRDGKFRAHIGEALSKILEE